MRVFVTGATGHIGSALVPELIAAGHEVTALARSEASALAARRLGAKVRRGDLEDLDGLGAAAREADGVIHLAFRHDAMRAGDFGAAVASDLRSDPGSWRGARGNWQDIRRRLGHAHRGR